MTTNTLIGQQLGPFSIVAELGRGGMGIVYRAYQPSLAREVALKVLPSWFASQPAFAERFQTEARAAARLHHPNIVTVHDVGTSNDLQYIVMELVPGENLEALISREGPLPIDRALVIAQQIAAGLDYAHAEGIVHRDVKSANVIVGDDNRATLTDFGIAHLAEQTVQQTITGTILGTAEYIAPEQAEGKHTTSAADNYAFACVLFELLVGHPPFKAETPMGVIVQHLRTPPPRISSQRSVLPNTLDPIFRRALAKDPATRYATCGELVREVAAALHPMGANSRPSRSTITVMAAVAAATLVMLLAVAVAGSIGHGDGTGAAAVPTKPTLTAAPQLNATPVLSTVTAQPTQVAAPDPPTTAPNPPTTPAPPPVVATPEVPTAVPPTRTPTSLPTSTPTPLPTRTPTSLPTLTPTPLPTQTVASILPATAPAGSLVVSRGNTAGGKDLFRLDLSNSKLTQITNSDSTWNWAPAVSCDGQWIAFAMGSPSSSQVAKVHPDGTGRTSVATSSTISFGSPWFLPNGQVVFGGQSGGAWEIYGSSGSASAPTQITNTPNIDGTRLPTHACGSSPLAIAGKLPGASAFSIFIQASNSSSFQPVTPPGVDAYAPAWSRDGTRLAYQSAGAGIVTAAPDGTDVRRVVTPDHGSWARSPAWSPDGRWIAYVSGTSADDGNIFVVPSTGGQPRQVTFDSNTYDWRPAWLA
jgi:serine/threonine-protein kinase